MDNKSLEYDFSGLEPPRGRILEIKSRSVGLQSPPQKVEKLSGAGVWVEKGQNLMFKARGIAIIDYELPNGFIDAAEEQQRLKDAISNLVKGNPRVVFSDVDIRERREHRHHNGNPNIKKMKIRVS